MILFRKITCEISLKTVKGGGKEGTHTDIYIEGERVREREGSGRGEMVGRERRVGERKRKFR